MNHASIDALSSEREWRCLHCGKLLGHVVGGRLHLRLGRSPAYLVGFPATTACGGCRTLNEIGAPPALMASSELAVPAR